ncbi:MAG: hypothetical protein ACXVUE_09010 [Solirubrobacteraceae bacterium]
MRQHTRNDGKPPYLHSLTRRGLEVAQSRKPAPAISPKREWRPIEQPRAGRLAHDLHALGWAIEFHRAVGELAQTAGVHPATRPAATQSHKSAPPSAGTRSR